MKNIIVNSKKLIFILLFVFILIITVSCSSKKNEQLNSSYNKEANKVESSAVNTEKHKENLDNIDHTKDETQLQDNISTENNIAESDSNQDYTSNDIKVINYFNEVEIKVDTELKKENNQTVKDKLKGTFITIVDFLFYNSEINSIKFDDLTEGAKQNILETASSIDNKIMSKYPNYKEEISTTTKYAYNKASELIKQGANNIKGFSKEKLGEENYNSIIEVKDELIYYTKTAANLIGDVVGGVWETSKSKIKTWYEKIKN